MRFHELDGFKALRRAPGKATYDHQPRAWKDAGRQVFGRNEGVMKLYSGQAALDSKLNTISRVCVSKEKGLEKYSLLKLGEEQPILWDSLKEETSHCVGFAGTEVSGITTSLYMSSFVQ